MVTLDIVLMHPLARKLLAKSIGSKADDAGIGIPAPQSGTTGRGLDRHYRAMEKALCSQKKDTIQ
jgi:hypothetical protein